MPLKEVAKRAPNLGYQLYFSEQKSSHQILAHVGHPFCHGPLSDVDHSLQLGKFIDLVFDTSGDAKIDFTPTGQLEKLLSDPSPVGSTQSCLTDEVQQALSLLGMQR